jgi:hypothetical protein
MPFYIPAYAVLNLYKFFVASKTHLLKILNPWMVFASFNLNRSLVSFLFTWALYNVHIYFLLGINIIEDSCLRTFFAHFLSILSFFCHSFLCPPIESPTFYAKPVTKVLKINIDFRLAIFAWICPVSSSPPSPSPPPPSDHGLNNIKGHQPKCFFHPSKWGRKGKPRSIESRT